MSADNWTPKRWSRRRTFLVGGTVTAGLAAGALGTVLALAGTPAAKAPAASAANNGAASHAPIPKGALTAISQSAGTGAGYYAYLAAAGGDEVVEINVAAASIVGTFSADSGEGVAAAPDGSEIYIAETGQYSVLAENPATKAQKAIEVGPYRQDVAVSPTGKVVYATVTGGDTGPDGSNVVAVIDPSTDTVTTDIKTGTAPRQVVFSPDGGHRGEPGRQDPVRHEPQRRHAADGQRRERRDHGQRPRRGRAGGGRGAPGRLAGVGRQRPVRSVSVIATATGKLVATAGGGPGTSTLDAAITDIAFAPAP